jgi:hypothetical protein
MFCNCNKFVYSSLSKWGITKNDECDVPDALFLNGGKFGDGMECADPEKV